MIFTTFPGSAVTWDYRRGVKNPAWYAARSLALPPPPPPSSALPPAAASSQDKDLLVLRVELCVRGSMGGVYKTASGEIPLAVLRKSANSLVSASNGSTSAPPTLVLHPERTNLDKLTGGFVSSPKSSRACTVHLRLLGEKDLGLDGPGLGQELGLKRSTKTMWLDQKKFHSWTCGNAELVDLVYARSSWE